MGKKKTTNKKRELDNLKLPVKLKEILEVSDIMSTKAYRILKEIDKQLVGFNHKRMEKEIISYAVKVKQDGSKMAYLNFTKHKDVNTFSKVQQDYINNRAQLLEIGRNVFNYKLSIDKLRLRLKSVLSYHSQMPDITKFSAAKTIAFWNRLLAPIEEFYLDILSLENAYEETLNCLDKQGFALSSLAKTAELLNKETLV